MVLQVDTSTYGLGATILQPSTQPSDGTFDDSSLHPITYSSKSLNPTEQRYDQAKNECLAIIEAFDKFDQWLLGKSNITAHTDHQPLQSSFQKDLASAPKRLLKMMLFLQLHCDVQKRFITFSGYPVKGPLPGLSCSSYGTWYLPSLPSPSCSPGPSLTSPYGIHSWTTTQSHCILPRHETADVIHSLQLATK